MAKKPKRSIGLVIKHLFGVSVNPNLTAKTEAKILSAQISANKARAKYQSRFDHLTPKIKGVTNVAPYSQQPKDRIRSYVKQIESFKSEAEAQRYLKRIQKWTKSSLKDLDESWRKNTITALQRVYGPDSLELQNKILSMSLDDFVYTMKNNLVDIRYIYNDSERDSALSELESTFDV